MQLQHLGGAEPRLVAEQLGQVADAGAGGRVAGGLAEQHHLAGVGPHQPEQHLDDGGLARAVGPEQPDDLAAADLQADPVHGGAPAVALAQAGAPGGGRRREVGDQLRRGPERRVAGRGAQRSPRATARTSSASSGPATTVSSPSATQTTAASVRSRVVSTVARSPATSSVAVVT